MTVVTWTGRHSTLGGLTPLADGGFFATQTLSESRPNFSSDYTSYGQLYDKDLNPVGTKFQIGSPAIALPDNLKLRGDVVSDVKQMPDGTLIVGISRYSSLYNQPGDPPGVSAYYQRFSTSGQPLSDPVQAAGGGSSGEVEIVPLGGGHVAVWRERYGIHGADIYFKRFAADGTELGTSTKVNVLSSEVRGIDAVALEGGRLLLSWGGYGGPQMRIYDANGTPVTGEIAFPYETVEALDNGNFAAIGRSGTTLRARIFDANGNPVAPEVVISTEADPNNSNLDIAALPNGAFVVAWQSTDYTVIWSQLVDASGNKQGPVDYLTTVPGPSSFEIVPANDGRILLNTNEPTGSGSRQNIAHVVSLTVQTLVAPPAGAELVGNAALGDILHGHNGNDTLYGLGGTDYLYGNGGNDSLFGGTEADQLYGGAGDDYLEGGDGADRHFGGDGNDYVYGMAGDDYAEGGDGVDSLFGGAGDDRLYGGYGNDYLQGDAGRDALFGDAGDDYAYGLDGDDYLEGGDGVDSLFGGNGNDLIYAGYGNDYMSGGDGDDRLVGEAGDDYAYGGAGNDTLEGRDGSDSLFGNEGNDLLLGGYGNDYLYGGAGNDILDGEAGDDRIYGEGGDDIFVHRGGQDGYDVIVDFAAGAGGGDVLRLLGTGYADSAAVIAAAVQASYGVVITTGTGSQVVLEGIQKTSLDAGDFLLV